MKLLLEDTETTAKPLHDPFDPRAKLCYVGLKDDNGYKDYCIEYSDNPYAMQLEDIQRRIDNADLLVGANPKFDINWLRRYGIKFDLAVWDVLLVQFILNHQTTPYVSLNDVLSAYGLPLKLDVVKTKYWDRGLDTTDVPEPILREYLQGDTTPLEEIYHLQYDECKRRGILPLVSLHNDDLWLLADMEWNGNMYDSAGSRHAAAVELLEVRKLKHALNDLIGFHPRCWSTDFISIVLYGGIYKYKQKEQYIHTYKDGSTKEKVHWVEKEIEFPRLVDPIGKERSKEGYWSTDHDTLTKLRVSGKAKKITENLLLIRDKEKLVGTSYKGFPLRIREHQWENELIHTTYNQAKVVTGRLSSEKPNMQNIPKEQKQYFISRFKC